MQSTILNIRKLWRPPSSESLNGVEHILTFSGTLNVLFFSFFSVPSSTALGSSILEFETLPIPPLECKFSVLSSLTFLAPDSTDMLGEVAVVFSTVRFFFGTSTHSDISITASARSRERIPLLLKEKCRFALMGEDKFRAEYLDSTGAKKLYLHKIEALEIYSAQKFLGGKCFTMTWKHWSIVDIHIWLKAFLYLLLTRICQTRHSILSKNGRDNARR